MPTIQGDLTIMEDRITAVEGMDYVFMCAATTSGGAVMTATPLAHVTPNVVMNAQLMDAIYDAKVMKFVFISIGARGWGTGDDVRDLIYIDDFIDGML